MEETVTATLRMESYKIKSFKAAPVHLIDEAATSIGGRTMESTIIGEVGERRQEDPTAKLLKTVLERVERIEAREHEKMPLSNRSTIIGIDEIAGGADSEGPVTRQNPVRTQPSGGGERNPVVCHRCGQEGQYACGCAVRSRGSSGNF